MYAADFRAIARRSLAGKWVLAVVAGLIVSLLSGELGSSQLDIDFIHRNNWLFLRWGLVNIPLEPQVWATVRFLASVLIAIALFVLYSVISIGYAEFNMDLVEGKDPDLRTLFAHLPNFPTAFLANLMASVYTILWSLLLIIPGVMAAYSYAMVPYVLAASPSLSASEALAQSKQMMYGHRWRLFCLDVSFIGWFILSIFTFYIGFLWFTPYREAARAAFYLDLRRFNAQHRNVMDF